MHGRPRQRAGEAPSPLHKKEQAQAVELQKLMPLFLKSHRTCCYSIESMNQNERLLEVNPEFYTAWNYRKRAVLHWLRDEINEEACKRIIQTELDVVFRALMVNPKCYGAWYHRMWVMSLPKQFEEDPVFKEGPMLDILKIILKKLWDGEFVLLKKLLKLDARNFHGWNYRRFVAARKGVHAEEELRFTTEKINENFSNYSSWHNRSALLSEIFKNEVTEIDSVEERLEEEYELVKNSLFTDPDDQSGWFFYGWLLGQTVAPVGTHLNGLWPPVGSKIMIDPKKNTYKFPYNKPRKIHVATVPKFVIIPMLLSFSNPVTCVNNQTVSVSIDGGDALVLDWRPVESGQKYCRTWTADIMQYLPSIGGQSAVSVSVGSVPGTISLDGQACGSSYQSEFHIYMSDTSAAEDLISLKDEEIVNSQEAARSDIGQLNVLHVLDREIRLCRELLELESNSKWTRLTLARILLAHASYNTSSCKSDMDEARTHFDKLYSLDPTHGEYYQHLLSMLSFNQLTEDSSRLSEEYESTGVLNLKSHGLCSVRYTERFLWVQNLDLSHNRLRSAHGLEELQLLVKLNLSHNRIGSVTALAPLRGLPLLENVDVSFNLIGDSCVDSCRYLCSSRLSNSGSGTAYCNSTEMLSEDGKHWEIKAVFEGVRWRELNIAGNAAAEDPKFVIALTNLMAPIFIGAGLQYSGGSSAVELR